MRCKSVEHRQESAVCNVQVDVHTDTIRWMCSGERLHLKHRRLSLQYRRNKPHDTNTEDTSTI